MKVKKVGRLTKPLEEVASARGAWILPLRNYPAQLVAMIREAGKPEGFSAKLSGPVARSTRILLQKVGRGIQVQAQMPPDLKEIARSITWRIIGPPQKMVTPNELAKLLVQLGLEPVPSNLPQLLIEKLDIRHPEDRKEEYTLRGTRREFVGFDQELDQHNPLWREEVDKLTEADRRMGQPHFGHDTEEPLEPS